MAEKVTKSKVGITERLEVLFNFEGPEKDFQKEGIWGYSSAGRAPALQAGGLRFDPAYLHQQSEMAEIWVW